MEEQPTLTLQVEVYTDSLGSASSNLRMSQGRADSIIAALLGSIAPERLTAVGYGEAYSVHSCRQPPNRAAHRAS